MVLNLTLVDLILFSIFMMFCGASVFRWWSIKSISEAHDVFEGKADQLKGMVDDFKAIQFADAVYRVLLRDMGVLKPAQSYMEAKIESEVRSFLFENEGVYRPKIERFYKIYMTAWIMKGEKCKKNIDKSLKH